MGPDACLDSPSDGPNRPRVRGATTSALGQASKRQKGETSAKLRKGLKIGHRRALCASPVLMCFWRGQPRGQGSSELPTP
jgi:hypothetical protein